MAPFHMERATDIALVLDARRLPASGRRLYHRRTRRRSSRGVIPLQGCPERHWVPRAQRARCFSVIRDPPGAGPASRWGQKSPAGSHQTPVARSTASTGPSTHGNPAKNASVEPSVQPPKNQRIAAKLRFFIGGECRISASSPILLSYGFADFRSLRITRGSGGGAGRIQTQDSRPGAPRTLLVDLRTTFIVKGPGPDLANLADSG
jgi:hypothetical protein